MTHPFVLVRRRGDSPPNHNPTVFLPLSVLPSGIIKPHMLVVVVVVVVIVVFPLPTSPFTLPQWKWRVWPGMK